MFIEILFKMFLFKGGVLIYAEHCIYNYLQLLANKSKQGQYIIKVREQAVGSQ